MKLTRSTSHLILSPDLAALVLCAMRLNLRETNGRRMGVPKSTEETGQIWSRSGRVQENGDAMYRGEVVNGINAAVVASNSPFQAV